LAFLEQIAKHFDILKGGERPDIFMKLLLASLLLLFTSSWSLRILQVWKNSLFHESFYIQASKSKLRIEKSFVLFGATKRNYNKHPNPFEDKEDGLVLDDFNQILEAIELYQQVFGDLDIPSNLFLLVTLLLYLLILIIIFTLY
jgi:hypothetical protein